MIYLDTSALMKLVIRERESMILREWLTADSQRLKVTSDLGRVEMFRACQRADPQCLAIAEQILAEFETIPIAPRVVERAIDVGQPSLRTLDAIHLASAVAVRGYLSAFVAYDQRLAEAALAEGLPVVAPG